MMLSFLVPFRSSDPARVAAWRWVRRRLEATGAEVVVGSDAGEPFSKAVALHDAFARSHGQLLVIGDADVAVHALQLTDAVRLVEAGAPWAYPYTRVVRLSPRASADLMSGDWLGHWDQANAEEVRDGSPGGMLVIPREAWIATGGMDRRFRGWGGEDVAFRVALRTLWGLEVRVAGDLVHLWHPAQMAGGQRAWTPESRRRNAPLMKRYQRAAGSVPNMRALVAEAAA